MSIKELKDEQAVKESPALRQVIDELQVASDNLPVDTPDAVREEFAALQASVLALAKKGQRSDADRKEQAEAEAEAKKPQ